MRNAESSPLYLRPSAPADEVVLLNEDGDPVGTADRTAVHTTDTPLHLAFSTYLFNTRGEVLLTRRALGKKTWPGVWTNSCCGHPRPGEDIQEAARRRVQEELGLQVGTLTPLLPDFRYRAADASGMVENEVCPVFGAVVADDVLQADPGEVVEYAWEPWEDVCVAVSANPHVYSPWSALQIPLIATRCPGWGLPAARHRPPDPVAARQDVEAVLAAEIAVLSERWQRHAAEAGLDVLPVDLPSWLGDLLLSGGKRIRVTMAYWGFIAVGGVHGSAGYQRMVRAAAALEVLHLFALIHDDVMDCSPSRRGRPSAHAEATSWHLRAGARGHAERFGVNLAILLGDLAHAVADHLLGDLPPSFRELWHDLSVELIAGQRADLTGSAAGRRDRNHAEHVARTKSGRYTVTRPLQLGALAAGAPASALVEAGDHLGQAFALRDDHLGVWGDPQVTGKPAGDDLLQAKPTVLLSLAHERLSGADAQLLQRVGSLDLSAEDASRLAEAMRQAGVADEVEALIAAEVDAAFAALDAKTLTPEGADGLREAASRIAWRTS